MYWLYTCDPCLDFSILSYVQDTEDSGKDTAVLWNSLIEADYK